MRYQRNKQERSGNAEHTVVRIKCFWQGKDFLARDLLEKQGPALTGRGKACASVGLGTPEFPGHTWNSSCDQDTATVPQTVQAAPKLTFSGSGIAIIPVCPIARESNLHPSPPPTKPVLPSCLSTTLAFLGFLIPNSFLSWAFSLPVPPTSNALPSDLHRTDSSLQSGSQCRGSLFRSTSPDLPLSSTHPGACASPYLILCRATSDIFLEHYLLLLKSEQSIFISYRFLYLWTCLTAKIHL